MTIEYSRLNSSDENKIRQIATVHENAPTEWRATNPRASEKQIRHTIELLKSKIHHSDFYLRIAETDSGQLVGFHWIEIEVAKNTKFGHIGSLWVSKVYRRQGIARIMKKSAEAWAKQHGAEYILTEVSFVNEKMLEFNKKLGFEPGQVEMKKDLR